MEFEKLCRTCKYENLACNEEPCKSCKCKSNWIDASKPDKFKAGDLVVMKNDNRIVKNIYIYLYDGWALRIPNYVVARSECDYNFSTYMYSLVTEDFAELIVHPKHASSEDIIGHDHRAKVFYISETLNQWFGRLIEQNPYIPRPIIPQFGKEPEKKTVSPSKAFMKDAIQFNEGLAVGINRLNKFPTLNANFIKRVIFSDPATIVFWEDGTKTVVKTQDGEEYDKEKGLAMAVCKKVFGNERDYYNVFKRWMRKGEERHEET